MPTLILPPRYTADTNALWKAAGSLAGWRTERLTGWRVPADFKVEEPVLYGETLFAAAVAEPLGLGLIEPSDEWLPLLPTEYLRRKVEISTLGALQHRGQKAFIKPAGEKSFPARVFEPTEEIPGTDILPEETAVLMIEPVVWELEFKCFVLNRKVVTMSPYLRGGVLADGDGGWQWKAGEEEQVAEFSGRVLADKRVEMPTALLLDVGVIERRGWAVIEANPAYGSGIYGCESAGVLSVLRRASVARGRVSAEDQKWMARV